MKYTAAKYFHMFIYRFLPFGPALLLMLFFMLSGCVTVNTCRLVEDPVTGEVRRVCEPTRNMEGRDGSHRR